eukprot:SAG31_NODE_900_length_11140_cov_3.806086_2_plen_68_part_00
MLRLQDETMQYYTTYSFEDLLPCANKILSKARSSYTHQEQFRAVREKYMQQKFDRVSLIPPCKELTP